MTLGKFCHDPFQDGLRIVVGDPDADPAFELIHVMDFHEIAQYEEGAEEPERSGAEAWDLYEANGSDAGASVGSYPTARFAVQGVFQGDERSWDEIHLMKLDLEGMR